MSRAPARPVPAVGRGMPSAHRPATTPSTTKVSSSDVQNTPPPSQNHVTPAARGSAANPDSQNGKFTTIATNAPAPTTWNTIQGRMLWRQRRVIAEIYMNVATFLCLPVFMFYTIEASMNNTQNLKCAEASVAIAAWTATKDICEYLESHELSIPSGLSCTLSLLPRVTGNSCDLEYHPNEWKKVKRAGHAASAIRIDHLEYFSISLIAITVMISFVSMFSARLRRISMPPHEALVAADRKVRRIRKQLSSDVERGLPQPHTSGKAAIIEPYNNRGVICLLIDGARTFRTSFDLRKFAHGRFHRLCRFIRGRYPSNLSSAIVDVLLADPHLAQLAVLAMLRCPEDFDYEAYVMGLLETYYVLLAATTLGPKGQPSRDHDLFPTIALLWTEALKHEQLAITAEILARLHTNIPWTDPSVRDASIQHMAQLYHQRFSDTHTRAQLETDVGRVAQFLTEGEAYANFRKGLTGVVNG